MCLEELAPLRDLGLRDTAEEVRPYVLRLGRGRVVDVTANVQVVVVIGEGLAGDQGSKRWYIRILLVRVDDPLDVLR